MKNYKVPVIFSVEGYFTIEAETKKEAYELANLYVWASLGSIGPDWNGFNWEFPRYMDKQVIKKLIRRDWKTKPSELENNE